MLIKNFISGKITLSKTGLIKIFSDKQKLKESVASMSTLQEILK